MKRVKAYELKLVRTQGYLVSEAVADFGLKTGNQVYETFKACIEDGPKETFWAMAVNAKRKPLGVYKVSEGIMTQAMAHPREVFGPAMMLGAVGICVAHNHPSGESQPSPDDHVLTRRLKECGELLNIPVLDHVILGDGNYFSYAENGWPRA